MPGDFFFMALGGLGVGAVKSRSEATALSMREGIKVRSGEFEQLREALDDVGKAKQRLVDKAGQVIGDIPESPTTA